MSKPVLQALLLADHVYMDKGTGKHVICGVFDRVFLLQPKREPETADEQQGETCNVDLRDVVAAGSPFAFASLTEVIGEKEFDLRFVDLSDNSVRFSTRITVKQDDPLMSIRFGIRLPPLPTPHPGKYVLELLYEDEILGGHVVEALAPSTQGQVTP